MMAERTSTPRRKRRTDAFTVVLHWGLVAAVAVSLLSGLRIAADYDESLAGGLAEPLSGLLLKGSVIDWHVRSGWTLTFIAISYAAYLWRSRQGDRVRLDRSVWRRFRGSRRESAARWSALNVVLYQLAFLLVGLMAATGWMLYSGVTLGYRPYAVATVHGVAAFGFVVYIVVHVVTQVLSGAFWQIFRPRLDYATAAGLAVIVAGAAVTAAVVADRQAFDQLLIAEVASAPVIDGAAADPAWREARAAAIRTARGANLEDGEVTVHLKAVHDGERVYFQFRWPDPQRSQKHLPLVKVDGGWRVMQSEFEIADENEYYEDKLSVVLARQPALGSGTVHLGRNLIGGPHLPTNRGLHFTEDGSLVDMWHWKSVRTGGMKPALVDDNFFGPPQPSTVAGVRYTGGYAQDPKEAGGYIENWTKLDPDMPLGDTLVVPKFLPASAAALARMGEPDLDPETGDEGVWYLERDEVVPYDPALDDHPPGTVLPSVVIDGAFTGDRGDLLSGAMWRDGYWTLEISRLLDTGSAYDVPLVEDQPVYLWVAVFNHTQTRHSQHLHPLRVVLE
ncbi:MAG: ethylbenzene dehydrogenase-related protein [Geminicoccaceae bacterium]